METDTKLQPCKKDSRCQAVGSDGIRCEVMAEWQGAYTGDNYSAGIKYVIAKLCKKHAKIARWSNTTIETGD